MKLRINAKLRAAVIAAITAVGFTLTQAQAATITTPSATNAAGWFTHDGDAWVYSDNYMGAKDAPVASSISFADGTGAAIAFGKDDGSRAMYTFAVTVDLSALTTTSDTYLLKANNVTGIGMVGSNRNLTETWQSSNVKYVDTAYSLPTTGIYTIVHSAGADGAWVAVYNQAGTEVVKGRTGNGNLKGNGKPTNFIIDDSLKGAILTFGIWQTGDNSLSADNMQLAAKAMADFPLTPPTEFTWAATDESAAWDTVSKVWDTEDERGTKYVSSVTSSAIFNAGAFAKDVTVSGAIKADKVNVNDDGYKFTVESENSLTIGTLTVANGKTATVAGAGSITLNSLTGALVIEAGATVNMPGTVTLDATHPLPVSGEGTLAVTTLQVAGGSHDVTNCLVVTGGGNGEGSTNNKLGLVFSAANGRLNLNAGTTTVTGAVYSNQGGTTINIGTGEKEATLVARRIELSDGGSSALHIGAKGKVVITSTNDTNGSTNAYKTTGLLLSEWQGGTTATVEGKLYAQSVSMYTGDAGMTLNVNNGGVVAVKGIATNLAQSGHTSSSTINLAEGGKIVLGASGMADCTIAPWTINLNGGEIGMSADTTTLARAMNVAGNVTFNTAKYVWSDNQTLVTGEAGGTMTVSGNLTGTGSITKTGAGELILSGTANVLGDTITLNGGTLSLTGAFNLDALTVQGSGTEYVGDGGVTIPTGSGFAKTSGTITVVDKKAGTLSIGKDATFTYGSGTVEVNAETGVATLSGEVDYSTLWVNGTDEVSYRAAQTLAGAITVGTVRLNHEGATVAMDMAATIGLVIKEGASTTVNATADTSISSLTGLTSNAQTFTVAGDHTVTLTSANTVNSAIEIGGTAKVKLGDKNALGNTSGVIVHTGATLDVNGAKDQTTCIGVTLDGGTLANTGAAASHGSKQLIKDLTVAKDSKVDAAANDFGVINGGYATTTLTLNATLEKVGSHDFHLANTTVTGSGAIKVTQGAVWFGRADGAAIGSYASDFIMNGGDIKGRLLLDDDITVTTTADGGTFSATVNTNGHSITFDGDRDLTASGAISGNGGITKNGEGTLVLSGTNTYTGDTVVKGGTLDIQGSISAGSKVKVAENATLAGNTEDISMSIEVGKTATIEAETGFSPKDSGVTFTSDDDIVTIENTGNQEITYSIGEANAKVTADSLVGSAEGAVTVENEVVVKEIVNYGGSPLTITHVDTETLQSIGAYMEGVTLQNVSADPIVLKDITLLGTTVAVYQGGEVAAALEGSVTITESLFAGASTLLANLEMADGSTLNVNGGNEMALTLGSKFTIADGSHVNLDETTIAALSQLQDGEKLNLIVAKEQTELSYGGNGYNGMSYDDLFVRTQALTGAYTVYANGDAFGLMKSTSPIPEPTTGTLSLLALMALAARRRRK